MRGSGSGSGRGKRLDVQAKIPTLRLDRYVGLARLPSLIIVLCVLAQPVLDVETNSVFVATFFVLFALFVTGKLNFVDNRLLAFLGAISGIVPSAVDLL